MISAKSFSKEWILEKSSGLGKKGDPKLLEKAIRAFVLLEQLVVNGLPLVFKGGTSLLLLIEPPRRFSIDIDIIVSLKIDELHPIFDKIIGQGSFLSWKDDNERKHRGDAPVGHYYFKRDR